MSSHPGTHLVSGSPLPRTRGRQFPASEQRRDGRWGRLRCSSARSNGPWGWGRAGCAPSAGLHGQVGSRPELAMRGRGRGKRWPGLHQAARVVAAIAEQGGGGGGTSSGGGWCLDARAWAALLDRVRLGRAPGLPARLGHRALGHERPPWLVAGSCPWPRLGHAPGRTWATPWPSGCWLAWADFALFCCFRNFTFSYFPFQQ